MFQFDSKAMARLRMRLRLFYIFTMTFIGTKEVSYYYNLLLEGGVPIRRANLSGRMEKSVIFENISIDYI